MTPTESGKVVGKWRWGGKDSAGWLQSLKIVKNCCYRPRFGNSTSDQPRSINVSTSTSCPRRSLNDSHLVHNVMFDYNLPSHGARLQPMFPSTSSSVLFAHAARLILREASELKGVGKGPATRAPLPGVWTLLCTAAQLCTAYVPLQSGVFGLRMLT
jgi:hypothetical protein